jgi:hypothetical protein
MWVLKRKGIVRPDVRGILLHVAVSWSARSVVIVRECGEREILRGLRAVEAVESVAALYGDLESVGTPSG